VSSGLKKIFSMKMTGDRLGMEAQPLFMPAVALANGGTHDLCICATMANTVYAFDANTGAVLWKRTLGVPILGSRAIDSWQINDHWGILSTPVLDNGMIYCVAWISPDGTVARAKHFLYEVKLNSGAISRSLPLPDGATARKQRSALTITNVNSKRTLFIPWGTILETAQGAHGYITAIDIDNWKIAAEWSATPTGKGSGIWMAGQGLTEAGDFFLLTGNGDFGNGNFAESFLRLRYNNGSFAVVDWWAPLDGLPARPERRLGRYGPGRRRAAIYPRVRPHGRRAGKDGILYVVDANKMGKTSPADLNNPPANYARLKSPPIWFTFSQALA